MQYKGSCHCGDVAYEAEADIQSVTECNCSICSKKGTLMAFVPEAAFTLVKGKESLTEYMFNKHKIQHLFCKRCGIHAYARATAPDGTKMVALNARTLDDVDVNKFPVKQHDGKSV